MAEGVAGIRINVPGFSLEAFAQDANPDQAAARRELSIDEAARRDGAQQLPPRNAGQIGAAEQMIRGHCQERLDNVAGQGGAVLGQLKLRVEEALNDVRAPDYASVASQADADLEDLRTRMGFQLQSYVMERWQRLSELTYFKRSRNLFRRANYPQQMTLHYGQLVFVIAIEMLANAFFFAQGSDQGLLGGAIFAGLFSVVNVAWSYIFGMLSYPSALNGEKAIWRVIGLVGVGFHLVGAAAINLTVAHYRDQLAIAPDGAVLNVFSKMVSGPLDLASLDAVMLVVIGGIISLFAVFKGYTSDDPVPSYGALDRAYRKADDQTKVFREEILKETSAILQDAGDQIGERLQETKESISRAQDRIEAFRIVREHVDAARINYQRLCDMLIDRYRQENLIVRSEEPPSYFNNPVPLDTAFTLLDITDLPVGMGQLAAILNEANEGAAKAKDNLRLQATRNRQDVDEMLQTHNERGFDDARKEARYTGLGEAFESFTPTSEDTTPEPGARPNRAAEGAAEGAAEPGSDDAPSSWGGDAGARTAEVDGVKPKQGPNSDDDAER